MRQPKPTAISLAVAQLALFGAGAVHAQTATPPSSGTTTIVVTGQRQALQTAQKIKQDAEEIVDSVVADEAGKLPDRSITEVLQRVVGVTVQRQRTVHTGEAAHFSEEGSGIKVRGLSWGSSNLNGREIFSAGWPGKDLSWGAIPTELMAGVDVYKNPSAARIEGAVSGIVDLRTALPFDYKGTKSVVSFGTNYVALSKKFSPSLSGLYSTQWEADSGRWGVLVDLATNKSTYESTQLRVKPYFPRRDIAGHEDKTVYVTTGGEWGMNKGESDRVGFYGALQWKKNDMQSALSLFSSASRERDTGSNMGMNVENHYASAIEDAVVDERGFVVGGHYTYPGGKGLNQFEKGGFGMSTSRAHNEHKATTSELAWNFKWAINDRWAVQNDLQWVRSDFKTTGHSLSLGTFLPSIDMTTRGSDPVQLGFDQAARDHLANPNNYFWDVIAPSRLKGESNLYAWKTDAKFVFEDPVLRDMSFGFRTSYRNSERHRAVFTSDITSGGWQSISFPWEVRQTSTPGKPASNTDLEGWQPRDNFAYMSNPKYVYPTELFKFSDFNDGRTGNLPDVVFPTYALMRDYPNAYNDIMTNVRYEQCVANSVALNSPADPANPTPRATVEADCKRNFPAFNGELKYGLNPNQSSDANQRTHAIFNTLRFGFDDWKIPVEGNVGLRVVYTKTISHGYIVFKPTYGSTTPPDLPRFNPFDEPIDVSHSHVDYLPSLNLKFNLSGDNKLLGRIALSRGIYRPDFRQLQESVELRQEQRRDTSTGTNTVSYTGTNNGNVKLKPMSVNNFDASLEWYPRGGQSLTVGVFYKDVKDIIYNDTYTRQYNSAAGNPQTFLIRGPQNAASGKVAGIEIDGSTYLDHLDFLKDKLPVWAKGFGVSANYSYLDSKQSYYKDAQLQYCPPGTGITNALKQYGCDTGGLPFGKQPLVGTTKHAANLALRYDSGPLSARLAYNWNGRSMIGQLNPDDAGWYDGTSADPARNGVRDTWWGLPRWQEAYGQWDAGMSYRFSDKFEMSVNATNLNNVMVRETNQYQIGYAGERWRFPGRSYNLNARYEF